MNAEVEAVLKIGRYRHYKGAEYEVVSLAKHSETEELLVVYRCLYGDYSWWVRPLEMFVESVEVDGVSRPRFAYVDDTATIVDQHRVD